MNRVLRALLLCLPAACVGCGLFRGSSTDARDVMHPDADVRRETVRAIGQAPPNPDALTVLSDRLLKDPDPLVRAQAARALGRHHYPESVPFLLEALKDANAVVRWDACEALGAVHDAAALDAVIAVLKDDDSTDVKRAAARSLVQYRDDRAVPALIDALGDREAGVAKSAANSLLLLTGQTFGLDKQAWEAWWATAGARS